MLVSSITLAQQLPAQPAAIQSNLVIWAAVLLGLAILLFILEVFIPSGGILGILATISMISGIVMLFRIDTTVGLIGAIVALSSLPFLFGFAIKIWPHTPIGRMLTLSSADSDSTPETSQPPGNHGIDDPRSLIGKSGMAITDLRPVGTCIIEGHRVDCIAEHGMIKKNTPISVSLADGLHIKVIDSSA